MKCKTCRWFVPHPRDSLRKKHHGACRVNPPQLVQYADEDGAAPGTEWPNPHSDDFCGKWAEKEPKP